MYVAVARALTTDRASLHDTLISPDTQFPEVDEC